MSITDASGQKGAIRVYGTPAEEGGSGKVYLIRAGLFDDVDAVVAWHAGDRNAVSASSTLANVTAKVRFRGVSAHASSAPHRGRSALDGVDAITHTAKPLREHAPHATRIHHVITSAGRVLISGSNTSPVLTSDLAGNEGPEHHEGYVRAAHNDGIQGAAAATFVFEELGLTQVATINDGDPYTQGLTTAFENAFIDLGGTITVHTSIPKGTTDAAGCSGDCSNGLIRHWLPPDRPREDAW